MSRVEYVLYKKYARYILYKCHTNKKEYKDSGFYINLQYKEYYASYWEHSSLVSNKYEYVNKETHVYKYFMCKN
jgi:hypothetical protein